jgi:hemoglobin/transferrin/lactoferrin receptor protein
VLNQADIERNLVTDIRAAAEALPNVSVPRGPSRFAITGVANSTGRDGNAGFSIRGLGGNRVLMMVDGIRVPHSYIFGGNAFGRDYVAMDLVKRIEVLRGPSSALYGSDGLAGLVNIITPEPADFLRTQADGRKAVGGRVSATWTGDNRGLAVAGTVAGQAREDLDWLVTASGRQGHGYSTMGTVDTPDTRRTTANPQDDTDKALLAKLVYRPGGGQKHVLTAEHVGKRSDINLLSSRSILPLTGTPAVIAGAILDERARNTAARDRLTWDAHVPVNSTLADTVHTVLGVQHAKARQTGWSDRNTLPDRERDTTYSERTWQASVQAMRAVDLGQGWLRTVTYGLDHQRMDVRNLYTGVNPLAPEVFPLKRFPDTRESGTALYAQSEWQNDSIHITPGLRWDHFNVNVLSQDGFYPPAKLPARSLAGSAVSPKLGLLYTVAPEWRVFTQYAGGFRAPNANQVNGYYENTAEQVVIVPNPDLKPEKSRSVEVGLRGRTGSLSLDAAVFASQFNNLIVENTFISGTGTTADPKRFQTVNTEKARIHGFELKARQALGQWGGGQWSLPLTYGWARGTNSLTGKPLNSIEPAKLTVGLDVRTATWSVQAVARHHAAKTADDIDSPGLVKAPKTQITTPSATTLDLRGQWRITPSMRLNVGLYNLTNRTYWLWSDVRGLDAAAPVADAYTQPGRHVNVSLVFDF